MLENVLSSDCALNYSPSDLVEDQNVAYTEMVSAQAMPM
jgi:hypothetical protein